MRTLLVAIGLLISTSAAAKPLPGGMKVVTKLGRPYIQQGATLVALRDDDVADYEKIAKAELAPDGKTIEVTATRCQGGLPDEVTRVPLAKIQARLDGALAQVALGKKQYAVAISKLTSAVTKDPETPAYGTSLLAAQLLGKKASLAGQTLAVQGKRNPIWFAWRIAVDADLAGARALKGAQDFTAGKPGTATVAKLGERDLATTTLGGGMAALRTTSTGVPVTTTTGTPPTTSTITTSSIDIDVVSLTTGKLLARLPLSTGDDACEADDDVCADATKERVAERAKVVDTLFAALGFEIAGNAFVDVRNGDPVSKDGIAVEISDHEVTASRGGTDRALPIEGGAWAVAFTPKAIVVKLNRRNLYGCSDGSSRFVGAALAVP